MDFFNRSKLHAYNIQKNKQQLSQQQPTYKPEKQITPNNTTTNSTVNTTTTKETLETKSLYIDTATFSPTSSSVQIQKSVEIVGSSLQNLEGVQTISNERRNIQTSQQPAEHIPSHRAKFRSPIKEDGFATSSRGNLVREHSEQTHRGKSSQELESFYEDSFEYQTKIEANTKEKRKRLKTFVLSEVAPQSFKAAPASETAEKDILQEVPSNKYESDASSSTLPDPQPFQYNLKNDDISQKVENSNTGIKTEIFTTISTSKSITSRPSTTPAIVKSQNLNGWTIRSSAINANTFHADEILTESYTTPLSAWRNGTPTTKASTNTEHLEQDMNTESRNKASLTSSTTSRALTTTTERSIQSFTARAAIFKDSLARTTGYPAQRFVSPYKSLENILGEKESNTRTTTRPRYSSAASSPSTFLPTTKTPLRSYFLITAPPKIISDAPANMSTIAKNLSNTELYSTTVEPKPIKHSTTATTTTTPSTTLSSFRTTSTEASRSSGERQRGRARYVTPLGSSSSEASTFANRLRTPTNALHNKTQSVGKSFRRKVQRVRVALMNVNQAKGKYHNYKVEQKQRDAQNIKTKTINRKPIENESTITEEPRAEALIGFPLDNKQENSIEEARSQSSAGLSSATEQLVSITDRPMKYFYSNKYRQQTAEHNLAEGLQNAGYITSSTGRSKFRPKSVLEQLQLYLAGESDESLSDAQFEDDFTQPEIKAAVQEIKNLYSSSTTTASRTTATTYPPTTTTTTSTTPKTTTTTTQVHTTPHYTANTQQTPQARVNHSTMSPNASSPTIKTTSLLMPMRASRVNNAIKSSIAAGAAQVTSATSSSLGRVEKVLNSASLATSNLNSNGAAAVKCSDSTSNAKCNEIPSRYLLFLH